jgi:hypothetical protein
MLDRERNRGLAGMPGAPTDQGHLTKGINQGRLVMASSRASGLAKRTNRLHQL